MRKAHEEQVKAITLTRANKRLWQRLNEGGAREAHGRQSHALTQDNINKNKHKTNSDWFCAPGSHMMIREEPALN